MVREGHLIGGQVRIDLDATKGSGSIITGATESWALVATEAPPAGMPEGNHASVASSPSGSRVREF